MHIAEQVEACVIKDGDAVEDAVVHGLSGGHVLQEAQRQHKRACKLDNDRVDKYPADQADDALHGVLVHRFLEQKSFFK
ncbi:hypothetical protein D3C76_1603000 [compost metagenome]